MKKYILVLLTGFSFTAAQSQEIRDALRYSQDNLNGTARYRAMSGAFGALGADLSSLNVNPAGSAVFINNQVAVTLSNFNTQNNSDYFGSQKTEKNNNLDINQAGGVFVFNNQDKKSDWKKFTFGVNYENANNFKNAVYSEGTNPNNSIDAYFLSFANGVPLGVLESNQYRDLVNKEQQAFLGYNAYIINPKDKVVDNTVYESAVQQKANYYQQNAVRTEGYNSKLSFNAATTYKDKLYIGLNLNSHFTDYRRYSSFHEEKKLPTVVLPIQKVSFDNDLYTYGAGFSFQLGAIAKVTNALRAGLAYESATWYRLNDELTQKITSITESGKQNVVNPRITNVYAPYKIKTPSKLTGSLAYVFDKKGLVSIDYAIKNYSNTQFKPENDNYFGKLNQSMRTDLANTSEIRVGAEYKIKLLRLRAGYRYEQSPYKDKATIGDLNGYSGGLGYNFGATKVDLSYAYAKRASEEGFFSQGFTDGAKINAVTNTVSLTFLFEL
ncbi:OmpP1/FadL family transporter [Flavobacterium crassostreae]|uniref:Transporter n=1 Tax=Flavobacterium crassostreae TaxID=1763534 RepID=A0A1B9E0J4_9FLAO|nr:outer membrane protein transport protein [Flavobacterium crassostreae]OCB75466.1 transporter [Flavobacterium crassostreae]